MNPKDILRWYAFAAAYFVSSALYGDSPVLRGANALGVFLLLLAPRRRWPLLAPVLWLAAGAAREFAQAPQPWLVGGCNVLEILAAAFVLHGRHGLSGPWYGREQLPRLLLAAGAVPVVSGAAAAMVLRTGSDTSFGAQWFTWYLASSLAYVTLMPLLLSWTKAAPADEAPPSAPGKRAAGIVLISVACVAVLRQELYAPLLLASFPLVVLAAWWYRLAGATTVIAVLAISGGWLAARDVGALFHFLAPGTGLPARVHALQLYLGAAVLCGLPIAVMRAELERLVVQLRRKSDARAEFLAAMSHEIRTPLTGVLGMADLLAAQQLTPEQRSYVDSMRASGRHLVSVVNDILDFSRIETGKLSLEKIDFRLSEMIEQVRSLIHPLALEKGLTFEARLSPGLPEVVSGDPTRLRQILLNLAGNAVKFTTQGSVELEVTGDADATGRVRYRFEVRDTGIGIPPDKLEMLFTPFTQADRSTAREYGGSGLGLAISRRLAEAMGGRIAVSSSQGLGSVFTLEVPLEPGDSGHRAPTGAEARGDASPQRILVAEDVAINRDILQAVLGARGHHIVFAHNGAAALESVQRERFDLVLMDVQMPLMDGVEATRRIRSLGGEVGRIPIIGLTANVMAHERESYLAAGMDACLMKPIDWAEFWTVLSRFVPTAGTGSPHASGGPVRPVLVDMAAVDLLQAEALGDELLQWIAAALQTAEECLSQMQAAAAPQRAEPAHKLKGTAGTFGLVRLGELAASIEHAVRQGGTADALVAELATALGQTRQELLRRKLLP